MTHFYCNAEAMENRVLLESTVLLLFCFGTRLNGQVTKIKGKITCLGCKIETDFIFGEKQWNVFGYQNSKYFLSLKLISDIHHSNQDRRDN